MVGRIKHEKHEGQVEYRFSVEYVPNVLIDIPSTEDYQSLSLLTRMGSKGSLGRRRLVTSSTQCR